VPYGPFRAGDGGTVFLSIQNEREFARFCNTVLQQGELVSDPRFATSPARLQNREAMHAQIDRIFSGLSSDEVVQRLEQAGIANARLNTMEEFWRLDGMEPRMGAIPAVGEHTDAVLRELGYSGAEVERLRRDGAV
jgi:crotonobetainyl-CoA:carnitine CoA-transferase CaiB-like acyl-CoA transferase